MIYCKLRSKLKIRIPERLPILQYNESALSSVSPYYKFPKLRNLTWYSVNTRCKALFDYAFSQFFPCNQMNTL